MLNKIISLSICSIIISNCPIDTLGYLNKIDSIRIKISSAPSNHSIYFESCNLVSINTQQHSDLRLDSTAAVAFLEMEKDAKKDSIKFIIASAFRSVDRQSGIISRKLNRGIPIGSILKENTLPGYSQHHSGRAIDFISEGASGLSVAFDQTKTFKWLVKNANKYGFYLSYPENNEDGIMYEPLHWMYRNE